MRAIGADSAEPLQQHSRAFHSLQHLLPLVILPLSSNLSNSKLAHAGKGGRTSARDSNILFEWNVFTWTGTVKETLSFPSFLIRNSRDQPFATAACRRENTEPESKWMEFARLPSSLEAYATRKWKRHPRRRRLTVLKVSCIQK